MPQAVVSEWDEVFVVASLNMWQTDTNIYFTLSKIQLLQTLFAKLSCSSSSSVTWANKDLEKLIFTKKNKKKLNCLQTTAVCVVCL